jgi:hypothetical protein
VTGWNRFGDEIYFVIARPNASPFQVPVWMTEPGAADMTVRELPRIDLAALRNLRRLLDATSPSSDDQSSTDRRDDDEKDAKASTELIRCADNAERDEGAPRHSDGVTQAIGAGPAHRSHRRTTTDGRGPRTER